MVRGTKKDSRAAGFLRAGIAHFNAGRYGAALRGFRRARSLGDRSPELRSFIAHARNSAGRPQAGLAPVSLEPGQLARAEKAQRKALAADASNRGARLGLVETLRLFGQARLSAGDLAPAENALVEALALEPRDKIRRDRLLDVLRSCGLAYLFAGRWNQAQPVFRRLLRENARDARAWHSLAGVMRGLHKTRDERIFLSRALRFDRGALAQSDRFKALMKLGRYKAAVAAGERILDGKPGINDIRIFWDPWEWDDRRPRDDRRAELKRFERALGANAKTPWLHYYRAELRGPEGMAEFDRIAAFAPERYGWMFSKAGLAALCEGLFPKAEKWFKLALSHKPADWRTHCFLAETYLCLRRPGDAFAEMELALRAAPVDDAGQVMAWRGAFDLWLGHYEEALTRLDAACALGAQCAFCWRAAALLKLGNPARALKELNLTLERYPRDFEAYVWRGEAKRQLGLYREALKDFNEEALVDPNREPPVWMWALFNRALIKAALGDGAGLKADFEAIPAFVIAYIKRKTRLEGMEEILEAGLRLSRGFRREEYRQAIWMS